VALYLACVGIATQELTAPSSSVLPLTEEVQVAQPLSPAAAHSFAAGAFHSFLFFSFLQKLILSNILFSPHATIRTEMNKRCLPTPKIDAPL
jgi:hypothetical protein